VAITASELKRKGVSIIERLLRMEDEVVISVSGKPRYDRSVLIFAIRVARAGS